MAGQEVEKLKQAAKVLGKVLKRPTLQTPETRGEETASERTETPKATPTRVGT